MPGILSRAITISILGRAAGALLLLPATLAAQQRVAPLPPACTIGGRAVVKPAALRFTRFASLAVLQLRGAAASAPLAFLGTGLPNAVASRIGSAVPRVFVLGRRVQSARDLSSATAVRTAGSELGVAFVLAGEIRGGRAPTRISFTLYDATTGKRNWSADFLYDSSGVLPIEQAVAIEVATKVAGALRADERRRLARVPSPYHAAYESAIRGDVASLTGAATIATADYRRAVQIDPAFADAHARLALADASLLEDDADTPAHTAVLARELTAAANQAVARDSSSALAWVALARARLLEGRPAAEWLSTFESAIARDSGNPAIYAAYGHALAQTPNRAKARETLEHAAVLDPNHAEMTTSLAEVAMAEQRDVDACRLLNDAIARDPLYAPAWALRALLRGRHADLRFAWADAETAVQLGDHLLGESVAARIDLTARDTTRARDRLLSMWQDIRDRGSVGARDGRAVAEALLALGDSGRALDILELVRPLGPWYAASLSASGFDRLRNEPRFRALISTRAGP